MTSGNRREIPSCEGGDPSAYLICHLRRLVACEWLGSQTLWKACQGLSGPQTTTPSCFSMYASMTLLGMIWKLSVVTT